MNTLFSPKYYLDRLNKNNYFTYSRFANYEFVLLTNQDFANCDRQENNGPLSVDIRQILENHDNIDNHADRKYIYHSPDYDGKFNELFKEWSYLNNFSLARFLERDAR